MEQGKIARLTDKGFGFISREGEDRDLFFHMSEVEGDFDNLEEGQMVSFEVDNDGPKGPAATKVTPA